MMVWRLLSFWDGLFSGAMLNFQGVNTPFHVFQMTQFAKELVYQLSIVNLKISHESGQITGNS